MCTHTASGHGIGCRTYTIHIYSDKHTSACEAIQISPLNLSEGGSLRLPIPTRFLWQIVHITHSNFCPHLLYDDPLPGKGWN